MCDKIQSIDKQIKMDKRLNKLMLLSMNNGIFKLIRL